MDAVVFHSPTIPEKTILPVFLEIPTTGQPAFKVGREPKVGHGFEPWTVARL